LVYLVFYIGEFLNKEFGFFPQYRDASVKPDSHKHFVLGPGKRLFGLEDLKQAVFKPNHIIVGYRPLVFQTHDVLQVCIAQRDMGIFPLCRGTGKLTVHLGQVGLLQKPVGLGDSRNPGKA